MNIYITRTAESNYNNNSWPHHLYSVEQGLCLKEYFQNSR